MRRLARIRALTVLGAVLALSVGAAPAHARTVDPLSVSRDGDRYTTGSTLPLFADIGRVVPGDVADERIWLRNEAAEPGRLRLTLVEVRADDAELAAAVQLAFVGDDGVEWDRLSIAEALAAGECAPLAGGVVLGPGDAVRVDAVLRIDPALGQEPGHRGREGAQGTVSFALRATLSDAQVGLMDAGECPPADAGGLPPDLPGTGSSPTAVPVVIAGALAVGIGLALQRRRSGPAADRSRGDMNGR